MKILEVNFLTLIFVCVVSSENYSKSGFTSLKAIFSFLTKKACAYDYETYLLQ